MIPSRRLHRKSDHGATGHTLSSPRSAAANVLHGFSAPFGSDAARTPDERLDRLIAVHSDPVASQTYFEQYISKGLRKGIRLPICLRKWVIMNDNAPFALAQSRAYADKIRAELAARGPHNS